MNGDSAQREARAVELCVLVAKLGWRCCWRSDGVGANEGAPKGLRFRRKGVAACHVVSLVESTSPPRIFTKSEWSEGGVTLHGVL